MSHRTARTAPALRRPVVGAVAAALAVAVLTGCGSSDPDTDAGAATTSAAAEETPESSAPAEETSESEAAETQAIEVTSVDFDYELAEDSFTAGTYEITLTNEGGASHNVVVERDGEDVASSEVIGPGETSTFEVTLEEGEYVFYCSVGNHRGMGMEVPVEVTA